MPIKNAVWPFRILLWKRGYLVVSPGIPKFSKTTEGSVSLFRLALLPII